MQNRSPPRVRRTFDTRRDALANRIRGMWRPAVPSESNGSISQEVPSTGALPRRLRVLVVDHDRRAADSLERLVHAAGHPETRVAYTGSGAVAFIQEFRPELVLVDIDMPDIDESALSRTLRDRTHLRHMRLIEVGGTRTEEVGPTGRYAAATPRLFKPITALALLTCLLHVAPAVR